MKKIFILTSIITVAVIGFIQVLNKKNIQVIGFLSDEDEEDEHKSMYDNAYNHIGEASF